MDEYMILLPDDESIWEQLGAAEREAVYEQHREFSRLLEEGGHVITGGGELTPSSSARTVRQVDGRMVVSDGPASDAVEQLSGFYLVETNDPDGLVQVCGLLASNAPVEVRRLLQPGTDA